MPIGQAGSTITEGGLTGQEGYTGAGTVIPGKQAGPLANLDIMGLLQGLFQDPDSAKALSDTVGKLATTASAAQKIPPHVLQMLRTNITDASARKQFDDEMNPYLGDITRFLTPQMAASVLGDLGIPLGRAKL